MVEKLRATFLYKARRLRGSRNLRAGGGCVNAFVFNPVEERLTIYCTQLF